MLFYTFSGTTVLLGMVGLCLATALAIYVLRPQLRGFNPLRVTGPAFRFATAAAIFVSFLAMNYARTQAPADLRGTIVPEEDLFTEVVIPPTATPPPPPPPPPPPVIETLPDELAPEEPETFVDLTVDPSDAIVNAPPVIRDEPAPPPPPPPPPPASEPAGIDEIEVLAEQMPIFGEKCKTLPLSARRACSDRELLTFVQSRVKYPALARENSIQGMVVVRFVVEKDGSISGLEAVREVAGGCTEEALRSVGAITREGERFKPGLQNGRPVRVMYNLPIRFRLD